MTELFHGAGVLLTVARHDRDFMWCEEVGDHFVVAGYKYTKDGTPLPQIPRAPQIVEVQDLGYGFARGIA